MDKYENKKMLTVEDIKDILGIGYNSAYEVVKKHNEYKFIVHKIGRQYVIPKDSFYTAFDIK